jgi:hypothetical protein
MAKTKEHLFNESYKEKVMVMGFSGKLRHEIQEDFKCSNCGITKKYFDRLVNAKRVEREENELKWLENLPPEMRKEKYYENNLKVARKYLGRVKLAKDCSLYKLRIK